MVVLGLADIGHAADGKYGYQRFYYKAKVTDYDAVKFYRDDTITIIRNADKASAHLTGGSTSLTINTSGGYGADCTQATVSSSEITLTCPQGGDKSLTLSYSTDTSGYDDTFWVTVDPNRRCGEWYVYTISSSEVNVVGPPTATGTLYIWAVATPPASSTELAGTASVPSSASADFTEGLYIRGTVPAVIATNITIGTPSWDSTNKYWTATYSATTAGQATLNIGDAMGTGGLDCNIRNKTTTIDVRMYSYSFDTTASDTLAHFKYRRNPCYPNIAYGRVTTSTFVHTIYTQSTFKYTSVAKLFFPSRMGSSTTLRDAWPMQGTNLLLTDKGLWYFTTDASTYTQATGLPSSFTTSMMSVADACDPLYEAGSANTMSYLNSHVVVWDATTAATTVYVSSDKGVSFSTYTVSTSSWMTAGTINQAMVMHRQPLYTLLVYYTTPTQQCILYNTNTQTWVKGYSFPSDMGSSASFVMATSGTGALFLFGNQLLYYSVDGCQSAIAITVAMRDTTNGPLESGETFDQVVSSTSGYYAIQTSKNKLLVGREGLREVRDVQSGYAVDGSTYGYLAIGWDLAGRMFEVRATSNAAVTKTFWPMAVSELQTQREPKSKNILETCPYTDWFTDQEDMEYLDVNNSVNVTAVVTSNSSSPVAVTVYLSYPRTINASLVASALTTTRSQVEVTRTIQISAMNFTAQYSDLTTRETHEKGTAAFVTTPRNVTFACDVVQKVTPVRVGCPPNTYLVLVTSAQESCDTYKSGFTYQVAKKDRNADFSGEQPAYTWFEGHDTLSYDYAGYGCPESIFWGTTKGYHPVLQLWENGEFVRNITEKVALYETNGRFDWYMFKNSPKKQCTGELNSRTDAVNSAAACPLEVVENTDQTWEDGEPSNTILFASSGDGGVYLFKAVVADYSASYCTLEVKFALHTYGSPWHFFWIVVTVVIVVFLFAMFVLASYCYYRFRVLGRKAKEKLL